MKKHRTELKSPSGHHHKHSAVSMLDHFFQLHDPASAKAILSTVMQNAVEKGSWMPTDFSVIVHFQQSIRSFIRAAYLLRLNHRAWMRGSLPETGSPWVQGFLSEEEYRCPVQVFKQAFKAYTIQEYDYFISGIMYFSLVHYRYGPESNLVSPFIHMVKMLDAAWVVIERVELERGRV